MCGICGKLIFDDHAVVSASLIKAMADTMYHRGPDDDGYYLNGPVGLGFRRLSIIDLARGHQPVSNEDGTVQIIFNGEIYNFQELRAWLLSKGHTFKTQSDTEVIVHLYEELGLQCVERLRGMFAFAIWDNRTKTIFLARDRVGIKPLYYHLTSTSLTFGSELKAILADPSINRTIAPELIDRFLTFLYVPGEETLLKGIRKLPPGHYLTVQNDNVVIKQYWDLPLTLPDDSRDLKHCEGELSSLLAETVELHMIADVPVGVLLSGGVDSTGVLSFAVERTDKPVSSFTVGFAGREFADERPYARIAADKFGTQHHELTISANDFASFMPQYLWHMEEPVCEPPAIALYYVSKLARNYVKVLLSGEGGDEAFAGYSNYRNLVWLERIRKIAPSFKDGISQRFLRTNFISRLPRVGKYLRLMGDTFPYYYYSRTSNPYSFTGNRLGQAYSAGFAETVDRERTLTPLRALQSHVRGKNTLEAMLYIDTKTWLPDDLLLKADKMTMANSVELRVPLLDHHVLEFAASLPPGFKLHGFSTKYILKKALAQRIPKEIRDRKKTGFPVPYDSWLRNELKDVVWDVLTDRRSVDRGYFRKEAIQSMLEDNFIDGRYSKEIFSLMSLELWQRTFVECESIVLQ